MSLGWALWLAVALAQDAGDGDGEPYTSEEVVIYGELQVERARRKVEEQLGESGYTEKIERKGRTIYRHEAPYMGQVVIDDDGWMVFERQPVRVIAPGLPFADENSPVAWAGCLVWAWACIRPGGQLVGKRKFHGYERRLVGRVGHDVQEWSDRIADLAIERKLEHLPTRLEALWNDGVPLDGGEPVPTWADRRQALLSYWASRTDNTWGEAVREAVEAFCRGVVQHSEHPFTEAEIAAFNRRSTASRAFSLRRRPELDPAAGVSAP